MFFSLEWSVVFHRWRWTFVFAYRHRKPSKTVNRRRFFSFQRSEIFSSRWRKKSVRKNFLLCEMVRNICCYFGGAYYCCCYDDVGLIVSVVVDFSSFYRQCCYLDLGKERKTQSKNIMYSRRLKNEETTLCRYNAIKNTRISERIIISTNRKIFPRFILIIKRQVKLSKWFLMFRRTQEKKIKKRKRNQSSRCFSSLCEGWQQGQTFAFYLWLTGNTKREVMIAIDWLIGSKNNFERKKSNFHGSVCSAEKKSFAQNIRVTSHDFLKIISSGCWLVQEEKLKLISVDVIFSKKKQQTNRIFPVIIWSSGKLD